MAFSGKAIITAYDKDNKMVGAKPIERKYADLEPIQIQAFFDGLVAEYNAKAADPTDKIERYAIVGA